MDWWEIGVAVVVSVVLVFSWRWLILWQLKDIYGPEDE